MQVVTEFNETHALRYGITHSSVNGVKSIKLRAAKGNTICIHEINGELVIKNE